MKSYREIADSVFARREQYVTAQRKKKKMLASAGATLCAVSLLGGSVWYLNRPTHDIPVTPIPDENEVTTTITTAPTEQDVITTTTTVDTPTTETTTDGGVVTPTTTVPAPSKPTATQAPTTGKTEPPKSTSGTKGPVTGYIPPIPTTTKPTTPVKDRPLITGDESDNTIGDHGSYSKNEIYISRTLQEKMDQYKGRDVLYAVHVAIPATNEDKYEDFWTSTEELVQFRKEYQDACDAYREEAWQLNPSWDGKSGKTIEVWTDSLREKYEYWLSLIKKEQELNDQPLKDYLKSVLAQRLEALKAISEKEPIYIVTNTISVFRYAYYVELTAEQINTLAAQGGYVFRLASEPNDFIVDM